MLIPFRMWRPTTLLSMGPPPVKRPSQSCTAPPTQRPHQATVDMNNFLISLMFCVSVLAAGVHWSTKASAAALLAADTGTGVDAAAAAAPASSQVTALGSCTPPRTEDDTKTPFCFIPETVSAQARQVLSTAAAGTAGFSTKLVKDPLHNSTSVTATRTFLEVSFRNLSEAAEAHLLQEVRNDTIAGVPVAFGMPTGASSSKDPKEAQLLIYLHGGGYMVGSCHYQWHTVAATASLAGLPILCVEYRLAPEHPFPAGLKDVLAVYKELIKQDYQAKNLVLLGDSAGGGMVAAAAILLHREGLPLPAALGMFSPWTELSIPVDSRFTLVAFDPLLSVQAVMADAALAYVSGNQALLTDPLVSPARADYAQLFSAETLLPPTLIQVGSRELLLSDALLLYHKMKEAATTDFGRVRISPYDAMWHVFQSHFEVPEAQAASKEMAEFFRRNLEDGMSCTDHTSHSQV